MLCRGAALFAHPHGFFWARQPRRSRDSADTDSKESYETRDFSSWLCSYEWGTPERKTIFAVFFPSLSLCARTEERCQESASGRPLFLGAGSLLSLPFTLWPANELSYLQCLCSIIPPLPKSWRNLSSHPLRTQRGRFRMSRGFAPLPLILLW